MPAAAQVTESAICKGKLAPGKATCSDRVVLVSMLRRRGGDRSGGQQQLSIARALVTRPRLLLLDEPTESIQASIIKDVGYATQWLRDQGLIAILLVEQYFDFVHELVDTLAAMDRGQIVLTDTRDEMDPEMVRGRLMM